MASGIWDQVNKSLGSASEIYSLIPGDTQPTIRLKKPSEIRKELDESVIGQDEAKVALSVACWNQLLSLQNDTLDRSSDDFFFQKSNLLIVGPTGCGKTHLVKTVADIVGLPVSIQDATSFSQTGYVGRDVNSMLFDLASTAKDFVEKHFSYIPFTEKSQLIQLYTRYGIIFVDEADKLRQTVHESRQETQGRAVQQGLLKMVEGSEVTVEKLGVKVDTSDILFILGGAFSGVDKIIERRLDSKSIGFSADVSSRDLTDTLKQLRTKDLVDYGMIPELVGRVASSVVLDEMTLELLTEILTVPKRSIVSQVKARFKSYGVDITFSKDALRFIAEEAFTLKIGARGLRAVVDRYMAKIEYAVPDIGKCGTLKITAKVLRDGL